MQNDYIWEYRIKAIELYYKSTNEFAKISTF